MSKSSSFLSCLSSPVFVCFLWSISITPDPYFPGLLALLASPFFPLFSFGFLSPCLLSLPHSLFLTISHSVTVSLKVSFLTCFAPSVSLSLAPSFSTSLCLSLSLYFLPFHLTCFAIIISFVHFAFFDFSFYIPLSFLFSTASSWIFLLKLLP